MIESITNRLHLNPSLKQHVSVENLTFSCTLRLDDERWKQYNHHRCFTRARNLGDHLREESLEVIVIPLNIEGIHWVVLFVNSLHQWIKYGDTLEWAWPVRDVERIQQWLRLHAFPSFQKAGSMAHGQQLDGYSCAIGMINIILHDLFGDPLFTDNDKHFLRIQEYLKIVQPLSSRVRSYLWLLNQTNISFVYQQSDSSTSDKLVPVSATTIKSTTNPSLAPSSHVEDEQQKKSQAATLQAAPNTHNKGLLKFFQPIPRDQYLQAVRDEMRSMQNERADERRQAAQDAAMTKIEKKERQKMLSRERKRAQRARAKAAKAVVRRLLFIRCCSLILSPAAKPNRQQHSPYQCQLFNYISTYFCRSFSSLSWISRNATQGGFMWA
jgi:hypothetical protein